MAGHRPISDLTREWSEERIRRVQQEARDRLLELRREDEAGPLSHSVTAPPAGGALKSRPLTSGGTSRKLLASEDERHEIRHLLRNLGSPALGERYRAHGLSPLSGAGAAGR